MREGERVFVFQGLGGLGKSTLAFHTLPMLGGSNGLMLDLWCQEAEAHEDPLRVLTEQLLDHVGRLFDEGARAGLARAADQAVKDSGRRFLLVLEQVLGAVFGLLNAFVKPIIQFLTLSLLFVTYGLVIIFINTLMLLILEFLFTDILLIENIWWAIAGGFLIGLLGIFLENLLGLTPPIVDTEQPAAVPKDQAEVEIDRTEHLVSHVETLMDKETGHETQN